LIGLATRAVVGAVLSGLTGRKSVMVMARGSKEDLQVLGDLMAQDKVTPVVDRRYGLQDVPGALRYLEAGHARGKVVILLEQETRAD